MGTCRSKDHAWYDACTDVDRKAFSPFLCLLWLGFSKKEGFVLMLNEYVNKYAFSLHKHPKLLWHLFCAIGDKKFEKIVFVKKEHNSKFNKTRELIAQYYGIGNRESSIYLSNMNLDDVLEMANFMGYEKDELTTIKKEWS